MTIHTKLLEAQKKLKTVEKTGRNSQQNYDFAKEEQVLLVVKGTLNDVGLVYTADQVDADHGTFDVVDRYGTTKTVRWAKVKTLYTVFDTETGDSVSGHSFGYGEDYGDKAMNKAISAANKYFLLKFFGLSTGKDDSESDPSTDEPTQITNDPYLQSAGGVVASPADQENYSKEKAGMKRDVLALADACGLKGHNQIATFRNISKALGMAISSTETLERLATIKDALEDLLERRNTGNLTESELKVIGV